MNKLSDDFAHSFTRFSKAAHLKIIKWDKITVRDYLPR